MTSRGILRKKDRKFKKVRDRESEIERAPEELRVRTKHELL